MTAAVSKDSWSFITSTQDIAVQKVMAEQTHSDRISATPAALFLHHMLGQN